LEVPGAGKQPFWVTQIDPESVPHPDKGGQPEHLTRANAAYETRGAARQREEADRLTLKGTS
jgi:hypothetical protein